MAKEEQKSILSFHLKNDRQLLLNPKQQKVVLLFVMARQLPGIGTSTLRRFFRVARVQEEISYEELIEDQFVRVWRLVRNHSPCYQFENNYRVWWARLIKIKSNDYQRLVRGLPISGQRTRTNARTAKKIKTLFMRWISTQL